jgi:hypothetical protein
MLLLARQQPLVGRVRPMILVLSPTRELAQQIAKEAVSLSTFHKFSVVTFVGKCGRYLLLVCISSYFSSNHHFSVIATNK